MAQKHPSSKVGRYVRDGESSEEEDGMGTFRLPPARSQSARGKDQERSRSRLDEVVNTSKTFSSESELPMRRSSADPHRRSAGHLPEKPSISVEPREVEIHDINPSQIYIATVYVKNLDFANRRIRIIPPVSKVFSVNQVTFPPIAPGLSAKVEIEFSPSVADKDFHDRIVVVSSSERIEVPIHAYPPHSKIQFDEFIQMGPVLLNTTASKFVEIQNNGTKRGSFSFSWDPSLPIRISPKSGVLEPRNYEKSKENIKIEIIGAQKGVFRSLVQVTIDGQSGVRFLDINATIIEQTLELILPEEGGALDSIHFGSLFFGQQRIIQAHIVNNSPQATSFVVSVQDGRNIQKSRSSAFLSNSHNSSEEEDPEPNVVFSKPPPAITVFPMEGTLSPFSKMPISVKFLPVPEKLLKGFQTTMKSSLKDAKMFHSSILVEVVETDQKIEVDVTGKALRPSLSCSEKMFRFGDCPVYDHLDIMFSIKNDSEELPVDFSIPKAAHFHINPTKGKLLPLQSQNLIASFMPNQIGQFKSTIQISICGGILTLPLKFEGEASTNGSKKKTIIGGIDKSKDDFIVPLKFIQPKDSPQKTLSQTGIDNIQRRKEYWEDPKWDQTANSSSTPYAMTVEELRKKRDHHDVYADFLRDERMKREGVGRFKKETNGSMYDDELNIGIEPGSGLLSPEPTIPKIVDPLYLEKQFSESMEGLEKDGNMGSGKKRGTGNGKATGDENVLIKRKFKPQPVTTAELRDCKALLAPSELMNVTIGHRIIEFGTVSVFSVNKKSFNVANDLRQSVLVTVGPIENDELKQTTPESQVIPPGQTAGFDIVLSSNKPQSFMGIINYTINGHHTYKITISGEIVPSVLNMSKDKLQFDFTADINQNYMSEAIVLSNPGNHPVDFAWMNPSPFFSVDPVQGTVPARGKLNNIFTFRSVTRPVVEETLVMRLKGGSDIQLPCIGRIPEAKCMFNEKIVEFGVIAVGLVCEKVVSIKNTGKLDAFFWIENSIDSLKISPEQGRILAGHTQELKLTLQPSSPQVYDSQIIANIRGGRSIKLIVHGEADIPTVEILQEEFNFGDVQIGGFCEREVTLQNNGTIPAIMYLDFSDYEDFYVSSIPDYLGDDDDSSDSPIIPVSSMPGSQKVPVMKERPCVYKLRIGPMKTISFKVAFEPSSLNSYAFELPLKLVGTATKASMKRALVAKCIKPPILVSDRVVDFRQKVIMKDPLKRQVFSSFITLTNDETREYRWRVQVDDENFTRDIFSIEPSEGVVGAGQSSTIKIFFKPREPGNYTSCTSLFLDGRSAPYMVITLKGQSIYPTLSFDRSEVMLPMIPLGMKSTATFSIINLGYDNLDVKYKLPIDTSRIPLSLNFPEGMNIGSTKSHLPVEVTFISKKPMSFTAKVEFLDSDGNRFSISITGASDNSLLSLQPYLVAGPELYEIVHKPGKPPMLHERSSPSLDGHIIEVGDMLSNVQEGLNKSSMKVWRIYHDKTIKNLIKWLMANGYKGSVDDFPQDLINSAGRGVVEFTEYVSGKALSGKIQKLSDVKAEQMQQKYQQYQELISFLKQHGALLNHVRPEYLLRPDEFYKHLVATNANFTHRSLTERMHDMRHIEQWFNNLSTEAWVTIIFQIIKIFVLSRVTAKSCRSLPGIDKDFFGQDMTVFSGSNFLSTPEILLLTWVNAHFAKVFPGINRRLRNFDSDFRDGLAIAALFVSHIPTMSPLLDLLILNCTEDNHFRQNANKLVASLSDVNLDFKLEPADIYKSPHSIDMILLCLHLYQLLPQYAPKAVIEFQGRLHEKVVKQLELANPTSKAIQYQVKLDGSSDFTIEQTSITIPPKSTITYPIHFTGRFSKEVRARLTLSSRRVGQIRGTTMVFDLKSSVQASKSFKSVSSESKLYDVQKIDIDVVNPFQVSGTFHISLVQSKNLQPMRQKQSASEAAKKKDVNPIVTPDAFFCRQATMELKGSEHSVVSLFFIPFQVGTYTCSVLLVDEEVGEFGYDVTSTATLPNPLETVKLITKAQSSLEKELVLHHRNSAYEKAKNWMIDLLFNNYKDSVVKDGPRERVSKEKQRDRAMNKAVDEVNKHVPPLPSILRYRIEYSSPFYSGPVEVDIVSPEEKKEQKKKMDNDNQSLSGTKQSLPVVNNRVNLSFHANAAGQYPGRIVLRSPYDTRIYLIEGQATAQDKKASLEFTANARQSITQDIPVTNNTSEEWRIKATLTGEYFHGIRDLVIPPHGVATYPLIFRPSWICDVTGELMLLNSSNGEKIIYSLRGIGEEPLAEDHVVLDCQARMSTKKKLRVYNFKGKPTTYTVQSDVPFITGESELSLGLSQEIEYEVSFSPQRSGHYRGTVTFLAPDGTYLWYTVEARVSPPPPERVISVESEIRRPMGVEIKITNPVSDPIEFEVVASQRDLICDPMVVLAPQETLTYEIIYLPLFVGTRQASVSFFNESVGEFWYQLNLLSKEANPQDLGLLESEIGKTAEYNVLVENPLPEDVVLRLISSNPRSFFFKRSDYLIPGDGSIEIPIIYCPSTLDQVEVATIKFESSSIGNFTYHISGKGVKPNTMDEIVVSSIVGQTGSSLVVFKNPFASPTTVDIKLDKSGRSPFELLTKKTHSITLPPFGELQIPFSFSPDKLSTWNCTVDVKLREDLHFLFPVKGLGEAPPSDMYYNFAVKARECLDDEFIVMLDGLEEAFNEADLNYEIVYSEENRRTLEPALDISLLQLYSKERFYGAKFKVIFEPLKPFKATVAFVVSLASGGRWRYQLHFESLMPEVDDTITIEAAIHKTESISFRLTNAFDTPAAFKAYFAPGSPYEFSVYPTSGILQPLGSKDGNAFIVSFTPQTYGKPLIGLLVIQTDEMQWSYEIRGTYPQYQPPTAPTGRRIDNQLSEESTSVINTSGPGRRNFLLENMKKKSSRTGNRS
eukprot:TRINITY_DN5079_c0_g1_i5.p1 TRINITY_DN5079_c0_g1~~TRINITY_DN5079_c0_g1_i5.p1  ORF type:complete len:2913 (-),score=444.38 TRINITY_DN5079_c0_g1_i5:284-9022(-)